MFATKEKMKNLDRLKKRSDFLWAQSKGKKWTAKGMTIIACPNNERGENLGRRFGVTVTKRLEKSAVKRNRMKRRLRAAAYDILPDIAQNNMDYVIIARRETPTRLYAELQKDLKWCLKKLECLEG